MRAAIVLLMKMTEMIIEKLCDNIEVTITTTKYIAKRHGSSGISIKKYVKRA